jgi:uncharacterized Ntn-hydrolase superfamily protein
MFENLPIPVAPDSELGRLLATLEAAEAAAWAQRLVCTAAVEAYRAAELEQRRSSYRPSQSLNSAEALNAEHAQVLALLRNRDCEEQRLTPLMDAVRELKERFSRDYQEFHRLRTSMDEMKRLAG